MLRFNPSYSELPNNVKNKLNKVMTLRSLLKFLAKVEKVVGYNA